MTYNYNTIKKIFKDHEGLLREQNPDLNLFFKDITESDRPMVYQFMIEALSVNPLEFMKFIPNKLFYQSDITEIVLPENITAIGDSAFYSSKLKYISIPGVTKISDNAFAGCYSLEKVENVDNLKQVGEKAFLNCGKLEKLKFSANISSFGKDAFTGCNNLVIDIPWSALSDIQEADADDVQLASPIFAMPGDEDFKNGRLLIDGKTLEDLLAEMEEDESSEAPIEESVEEKEE